MEQITRLYYMIFVLVCRYGGKTTSTFERSATGVIGVSLLEFAVVLTIGVWAQKLSGHMLFGAPNIAKVIVTGVVLFGFNYLFLVSDGQGAKFERHFNELPSEESRHLWWRALLIVVSILVILMISMLVAAPPLRHP